MKTHVDLHRGQVELLEREGKGTTAVIWLPLDVEGNRLPDSTELVMGSDGEVEPADEVREPAG